MTYNKRRILGHINEAFSLRGWKDNNDIQQQISGMLADGETIEKVINALPPKFKHLNNIGDADVLPILRRVMQKRDILETQYASKARLLLAYASPLDEKALRMGAEEKQIKESLLAITDRSAIVVETIPAVELGDFSNAFNRFKPNILHISAHGNEDLVVLEDNNGNSVKVDEALLTSLVSLAEQKLKIVVLSACNSFKLAEKLTKVVDIAIGMNASIGDSAARTFAVQFYSSIGEGMAIGTSFRQAKFAITANGINESDIPVIFTKKGINQDQYRI